MEDIAMSGCQTGTEMEYAGNVDFWDCDFVEFYIKFVIFAVVS